MDFFFQAEDGIRDQPRSRGLGDVYKRQNQQHGLFGIGVAHQAPANGSLVPAPEVVAWAHALACCASASWRANGVD